ncbi:MAG: beta-galactosidase, partial [Lentisphaerae bacterium]|nr:beta-galactosidase [Lentisphaerota bacterium]
DWVKVAKDGCVYKSFESGYILRQMCLNSGYRDHLKTMIREILGKYPVDGLFLDCFSLTPCYGTECLQDMKKRGMNILADGEVAEFCRIITVEFMDEVKAICKRMRKNIYICFNGMPYHLQPKHIELEILPTGGWGYDCLPFAIRYARKLGKPLFTMTGRFHKSWADFGGLKPQAALMYECCQMLAHGARCSVGDQLHPRGILDAGVYDLIGSVYRHVEACEPWCDGAKPVTDIAILTVSDQGYHSKPGNANEGAVRALTQLGH